jgi:hypothetical protein
MPLSEGVKESGTSAPDCRPHAAYRNVAAI